MPPGTGVSARALAVDGQRGTIAPGKLADLVLVEGRPDERIDDVLQTRRVFLGGSEAVAGGFGEGDPVDGTDAASGSAYGAVMIDDMERGDGRTAIDTLRVNGTDAGRTTRRC